MLWLLPHLHHIVKGISTMPYLKTRMESVWSLCLYAPSSNITNEFYCGGSTLPHFFEICHNYGHTSTILTKIWNLALSWHWVFNFSLPTNYPTRFVVEVPECSFLFNHTTFFATPEPSWQGNHVSFILWQWVGIELC